VVLVLEGKHHADVMRWGHSISHAGIFRLPGNRAKGDKKTVWVACKRQCAYTTPKNPRSQRAFRVATYIQRSIPIKKVC
jgi:hypothetical protein